ncbi:MAG TPA: serine hydroxymethyltransferase [Patescibacteria group bacterium]|nr:serine hydroxymethyltransferase [Patescibacteria group bacterium]
MDTIQSLIKKEEIRQRETLSMIPSENITYPEVLKAVGSVLMQKYSEGQPGKRYYQGNEFIDEIELLTKINALELFHLTPDKWAVNVQALSGAPANLAIYNALLNPGDKILSLYLPDGGHLSHGWHIGDRKVTLISKIYDVDFYHVTMASSAYNDQQINGLIDYDALEKKTLEFKPKIIVSGGTAYPREIDHKRIGEITKKAGSYYLADVSHEAGLIAAGVNADPFPYADVVMMTTHKTLRGPRGALIFSRIDLANAIDSSVFPGLQGGPHNEIIAGIGIALQKDNSEEFKKYARQVVDNAKELAQKLMDLGLTLITNGTDKHLILIDLRPLEINSWFVAYALEKAGIIVNRNAISPDGISPRAIFYPSGIRIGTPAITARGMGKYEIDQIADWIMDVINHLEKIELPEDVAQRKVVLKEFQEKIDKDQFIKNINKEVKNLCEKFPLNIS